MTPTAPLAPPVDSLPWRRFLPALLAILVVGALLHPFPEQFVFRNGGDCVLYRNWGRTIAHDGIGAFPRLTAEYRRELIGYPPPTRWAWVCAIALSMKAWRHPADEYHPIVLLSWLAALLTVVPVGLWLRRRAPPSVTLLAMLLVAVAPLERALGHFPLPDAMVALWSTALLATTAAWLDGRQPVALAAMALFTLLLLGTRETGAFCLCAPIALVLASGWRRGRIERAPLVAILAGCVAMTIITIPVAGGVVQLWLLAREVVYAALFTSGALLYAGGPPYRYLVDFMILSPLVVCSVLLAAVPLRSTPAVARITDDALVTTLAVLVPFSLVSKTLRYVIPVDVGLRVLAALAVWRLWQAGGRTAHVAAVVLALGLVAADLAVYVPLWGRDQIYDPVTWGMAKYLRMIPDFGPGVPL